MRNSVLAAFLAALVAVLGARAASAQGAARDCDQFDDMDRRVRGCSQLIQQNPRNVEAYRNRAYAHRERGQFEQAIADYAKIIELAPRDMEAHFERSKAQRDAGKFDEAIADLSRLIASDPRNADSYLHRGWAFQDKNDFARARADFDKVVELQPKEADGYSNRGHLFLKMGEHARALAEYEQAVKRMPALANWLRGAIATAKAGVADASRGPAGALVPPASAPAPAAAATPASSPTPSQPAAAEGSAECNRQQDADAAIVGCTAVIQRGPQNAEALLVRAGAYHDKRAFDRAIADYTGVIKLQAKNAVLYNERGYAHFETGDFDLAISDFSRAIEIKPDYLRAYLNRGRSYAAVRAYELAIKDFVHIASADPASSAVVKEYLDDANAKLAQARTGEQADADHAICANQAGSLGAIGKFTHPAKIEVCSRAIASRKFAGRQLAELHKQRGYAYSLTNDRANAVSDWDRLFELDPDADVDIILSRAKDRMHIDDRKGAIKDFQLYLQRTARLSESQKTMFTDSKRACAILELQQMGVRTQEKSPEAPDPMCMMAILNRR